MLRKKKNTTELELLLRKGGLKQEELPRSFAEIAYHTDLGEATIRNWAKGRTVPRLSVVKLAEVLDYLNVSFETFEAATAATLKKTKKKTKRPTTK